MNSLVVLFSVMALAAAKPSALLPSGIISYAAPAIALAPAAVSHQSRLDIKSSPAVITEKIVAPIARAVVAEPTIVASPAAYGLSAAYAAPAAFAAPITYTSQAAYVAPAAYSAPVAVSPAAISTQSRVDVKSSPAVLSTIAAAPILSAADIAYSTPVAATYTSGFFSPAITPAAALLKTAEVKPIALSNLDDAIASKPELPVAPAETPEVAAARAAHLEAKAVEESHQIHKRSVKYLASAPFLSTYSATPYISSPVYSAPIIRPLAVSHPVITSAYSIHAY